MKDLIVGPLVVCAYLTYWFALIALVVIWNVWPFIAIYALLNVLF